MKWLILIFGILSNASASVLIKVASQKIDLVTYSKNPLKILLNFPLLGGIVLYAIAFVLYAMALQKFPLSFAHPVLTSGAILCVASVSFIFFKEPFGIAKVVGLLFISLGIFLVSK